MPDTAPQLDLASVPSVEVRFIKIFEGPRCHLLLFLIFVTTDSELKLYDLIFCNTKNALQDQE